MDIYLICGLLIGVLVTIAVAVGAWVYKDANERGLNGTVWALVVVLTGGFGVGFYLGMRMGKKSRFDPRGEYTQQGQYPSSEMNYTPLSQRFCTECGARLIPGLIECQGCGSRVKHQRTYRIKK
ncbi:MAG: hypothetical protein V3U51_00435 [Thermoplasmata archaeon]